VLTSAWHTDADLGLFWSTVRDASDALQLHDQEPSLGVPLAPR